MNAQSNLFRSIEDCPACDGTGEVEICSTTEQECKHVPCDHCGGKGYFNHYNVGLLAVIALIAIGGIVLLTRLL